MTALSSTRVSFLSRRLRAALRPTAWALFPHLQPSLKLPQPTGGAAQMGVRDKCVADRTRSTVTYLCFSGNFTRLGVALKKGSYSLLWSGRTGSPATTTVDFLSNPRESFGHWASWSADESGVYSLTDSAEAHKSSNCWPMAVTGDGATCGESRIDRNHRSSLSASADHLGIHLLSASKLTGNFACIAAASMATKCSHWTRIGAINRMTRTTRDHRNNKWTVLEQRTRPQDEEQVPTLPQSLTLPLAEGVPLYAWQGSSNASALNSLLTAAPMYASLTSRPLTGCNAFNKLMTKTVHGVQARMMSTASLALIPCSHRLDSRLLLETASIATFPCSTVGGGVICKLRRMCLLILRAPCNQPCSSLWTSSGRFDNRRCWRCDKPINGEASSSTVGASSDGKVAICEKCGSIQPISGDVNFFGLFNLDAHYDIDLALLRQQYLRLQQNMHPDMNVNRSNAETEYSLDNSSIINSAYKTLRDPYQRALYLLQQRFNITIDEGNIETEPELLMEIMELNEDIELANDKESLMDVSARLETDIGAIVGALKTAFNEDNASEARRLVVRFAYYNSTLEKLKGQLASAQ